MTVDIGARIRSLRRQQEMDVTALARAAGLSRGYLSHVESGAAVPSIPALERLGEILGVPVSAFFTDGAAGSASSDGHPGARTAIQANGAGAAPAATSPAPSRDPARHPQGLGPGATVTEAQIVRANERRSVTWPTLTNHRFEVLVPDLNRAVEVMMLEVTPPDDSPRRTHGHYGESFVLVLEGTFEVVLEDAKHILGTGDAIYFPNSLPHGLYLSGDQPGRAIWVQSPPYF